MRVHSILLLGVLVAFLVVAGNAASDWSEQVREGVKGRDAQIMQVVGR